MSFADANNFIRKSLIAFQSNTFIPMLGFYYRWSQGKISM